MEKSFLNFKVCDFYRKWFAPLTTVLVMQAANPDWNPSDPSGSLYLSRIADLSARRRLSASRTGLDNTILLNETKKDPVGRAQEYDRALRQSQHAALRRRLQLGGVGIVAGGGGIATSTIWQPGAASDSGMGMGMAQTAVLGDSHGSIAPPSPVRNEHKPLDDGVGSGLGDSYVDGDTKGKKPYDSQQEGINDEEELEDGGVLGLLAQIYAAKNPPVI
jgi:autophagy-related protein 9